MIFTAFGDMMRVPGSKGKPAGKQSSRRRRADRLFAARCACKLPSEIRIARSIFFAIGFETTAPSTALDAAAGQGDAA